MRTPVPALNPQREEDLVRKLDMTAVLEMFIGVFMALLVYGWVAEQLV